MTEQNTDGLRPAAETMKPIVEAARQVPVHKHTEIQNGAKVSGEEKRAGAEPFRQEGYHDLARILSGAFDQSARGKGRERHANSKPFKNQPIMEIARMTGIDAHAYQVMKKAQEASSMFKRGDFEASMAEFRGVIIYAAAAILLAEEQS